MIPSSQAQSNESFYQKKCQQLIQIIGQATGEAADAINKFDVQANYDKLCISTVANIFSRDLGYTLNNLQRIMIDNQKKDDYNQNLNKTVQAFSTLVYSIQLAFGNDFNKLKVAIIDVLQNLSSKLDPLLDIVQEHSAYTSKSEIANILNYLYYAIEKVKMRIQWEHLDPKDLYKTLTDIHENVSVSFGNLKDKHDVQAYFRRINHEGVEGVLQIVDEMNIEVEYYDDEIRNAVLNSSAKLAASVLDHDKPIRTEKNTSTLILHCSVCALNFHPSVMEVLEILNNNNWQDTSGNLKNFILTTMVNLTSCSIRFQKDCDRIFEN